jgi:CelD/BcsL family acetyltransferase involved in cellulose biosynthesis
VIRIERLDAWTTELDELAASASQSTFYHTGAWLRSLGDAYPRMALRVLLALEGAAPRAFLPYFESRRGPLRALWSLPFGTYGGPAGEMNACGELWNEYRSLFSSPGVVDVGCVDRDSALVADRWESTDLSTHVVDISRGFDHLWNHQFDKPRRRRVRRAVEAGVTVRRGNGVDDMAAFMHVYRERLKDWKGGEGHPEPLFFALVQHGGPQVRLYVAEHGGTVVGGHLNFYYKDAVIAWYGMTSTQAGDTQAGTLLYSECMREACEAGFRSYNLGASLGKRSLIEYKESLGGTPHRYRMLRRRRLGGRVVSLLRRASRPA